MLIFIFRQATYSQKKNSLEHCVHVEWLHYNDSLAKYFLALGLHAILLSLDSLFLFFLLTLILEGSITEFQGFKATLFVDIILRRIIY